jgi:pimeloyl-ACP methyl ester carboxylesterase
VLAHQSNQDYCGWYFFAKTLAAQGYRALAFSFRNHGSSGRGEQANIHHDRDVAAAAAELRRRGAERIFLIGASLGGTAVVTAAPGIEPAVAGVVDLSGPASYTDLDALAAAKQLRVPVIFAVARFDPFVADTQAMYRASPSKEKRLVIRPGGAHGTDLLRGSAGAFMRPLLLGFLRAHRAT